MADIEIVYRRGYCEYNLPDYCGQCHTCCADDLGCMCFCSEVNEPCENVLAVIPFGDCARARFDYIIKGWTGKRYEMEECRDPYNPHLDSMLVTLGNREYDCVKVTLNGKEIFNEYDEEGTKE